MCKNKLDKKTDPNKITHTQTTGQTKTFQAVKNTFNLTTSKSPTRFKQVSHSDSSEDANVMQLFFDNFGNEKDNSSTVLTYSHGLYTKGKRKIEKEPAFATANQQM